MKARNTNMELLRIVSILMIVIFHCAFKSGFSFDPGFNTNKLIVKSMWMLGELGVNLFMLISGYFMVNTKFKWKKLILLLAEVQFYYWLTVLISCWMGVGSFPTGKSLFLAFFPVTMNHWWFITAYILIYILTPYLNLLAKSMEMDVYRRFLLTLLLLFCFIPTIFGFLFNSTESMLYYNRFIWLIVMYFAGAYISRSGQFDMRWAVWLTALSAAVMIASILLIDQFNEFFELLGTTEPAYFWPPNTIPMVALSLGVFGLFLHVRIKYVPAVNVVASTTLGVYLLSDGMLAPWLWTHVFHSASYQDSPFLFFRILGATAIVFSVGVVVDLARQQLARPLAKALNRLE